MVSVLIYLLPLVIGSIAMPTWILLVFLLLIHGNGRAEAMAFVGGVTVVRLLQGILFGGVLSWYDITSGKSVPESIISIVLLVTGLLLYAVALKQWRTKDNPDANGPRWLTFIDTFTPVRAFGLGALLVVTSTRAWLFTLAAIGVITQAEPGLVRGSGAFLFFVLGADLLLVAPILLSMRSSVAFEAAAHWLQRHNRTIVILVTLILGSIFVWSGTIMLLG